MNYIVTSYSDVAEWVKEELNDYSIPVKSYMDFSKLRQGDVVFATLSVHAAAYLCSRGADYVHIAVNIPKHARDRYIPKEELVNLYNIRLMPVSVERL